MLKGTTPHLTNALSVDVSLIHDSTKTSQPKKELREENQDVEE